MSNLNRKRYKFLHRAHWTHNQLTRDAHWSNRCTPNSYQGQPGVWLLCDQISRVPSECPGKVTPYVCTAGVRCGRGDLRVTSALLPCYYRVSQVGATWEEFPECMENFHTLGELWPCGHVCCRVSQCGQELVIGDIRIFRYEIGGTWVFTILLPCGGKFLHFPPVSHS